MLTSHSNLPHIPNSESLDFISASKLTILSPITMDFGIQNLKSPPFSLLKSPIFILIIAIAFSNIQFSNGSIHTYNQQVFNEVGNAYLVAGGSEGILASRSYLSSPISTRIVPHSLRDGISFIRYFLIFCI